MVSLMMLWWLFLLAAVTAQKIFADLRQMMIVSPSSDCDDLSLPILI
jgi:hypothetical protein